MTEVLHGRESQTNGPAELVALWAGRPEQRVGGGEYVPWAAVWVDPAISPRDGANTDKATVERYAEILDDLPAITVQRGTFRLIDGKHRLEAAASAGSYVRIFEVDVPDDRLFEESYLANTAHGRPLSDRERSKSAKRIWDAKVALGETPNQGEFARKYQVSRRTIAYWSSATKPERPAKPKDANGGVALKPRPPRSDVQLAHSEPVRRVPDAEPVQWSDEEHPVAMDDDGEKCWDCGSEFNEDGNCPQCRPSVLTASNTPGTWTANTAGVTPFEPGTQPVTVHDAVPFEPDDRERASDADTVLQAIEIMAQFEDDGLTPGDFLTPVDAHPLANSLTPVEFGKASAWLGKTSRYVRVGLEG